MIYTIAVDFDGTLVDNAFPDITQATPKWNVVDKLKNDIEWYSRTYGYDVKLILWTCREDIPEGNFLSEAVDYCYRTFGLEFDAVNENPWSEWGSKYPDKVRKIYADEYWDDKAVKGCFEWRVTMEKEYFTQFAKDMIHRSIHSFFKGAKNRNGTTGLIRLDEMFYPSTRKFIEEDYDKIIYPIIKEYHEKFNCKFIDYDTVRQEIYVDLQDRVLIEKVKQYLDKETNNEIT